MRYVKDRARVVLRFRQISHFPWALPRFYIGKPSYEDHRSKVSHLLCVLSCLSSNMAPSAVSVRANLMCLFLFAVLPALGPNTSAPSASAQFACGRRRNAIMMIFRAAISASVAMFNLAQWPPSIELDSYSFAPQPPHSVAISSFLIFCCS